MGEDVQQDVAALSFEDALKRLETIVARLESGDASLDESITLYAEGDKLRAQCEARLASAQARIEKITLGQDGRPAGVQPFDAG
jgi:exodeoxyribonuclease VII small subunit